MYEKTYFGLSEDELKQAKALLAIRNGLVNCALVVDPKLTAATLVEQKYKK